MSQEIRVDVADLDSAISVALREQRAYEHGMGRTEDSPYSARLQEILDAIRSGSRIAIDYDRPAMTESAAR